MNNFSAAVKLNRKTVICVQILYLSTNPSDLVRSLHKNILIYAT